MSKPLSKNSETCPMLSRSDWGVGHIQQRGLTHSLSVGQSPVGFHGPKVAGWLVFLNGCHRGEDTRLTVGESKLGSAWSGDIVITGVGIGSQHALIRMGMGEGSIIPVSPDKVIKINNERISGPQSLSEDMLITIGEVNCVVRFAESQGRGYQPPEVPKAPSISTQAALREMVCGWLVMTKGTYLGQDFRLVTGNCRLGSSPGLEVTIADPHLAKHALTLAVTAKECKVTWIADGHKLLINGTAADVGAIVRESDTIHIDHVEGYLKWFRP
jgi:hypothetical protein